MGIGLCHTKRIILLRKKWLSCIKTSEKIHEKFFYEKLVLNCLICVSSSAYCVCICAFCANNFKIAYIIDVLTSSQCFKRSLISVCVKHGEHR